MELAPITFTVDLGCSPEHAFAAYTERIGEWWSPRYTANADTLETVVLEGGVGGRVFERHTGGDEIGWGNVVEWEPPHAVAYSSTLAQEAAHPSEVAVRFESRGSGCRMVFEHRGWTEGNAASRDRFGDWPVLLGRFADLAMSSADAG